MLTRKQLKEIIRDVRNIEKGPAVSELDSVFKRGYRAALRLVEQEIETAIEKKRG